MQKNGKENQKMTDMKTVKWLLNAVRGYGRYMFILVLLQILVNGGAVGYALIIKEMVDSAVARNRTEFVKGLVAFGALMAVIMLIRILIRRTEEATRSGMENRLKARLFEKLLWKDYECVNAVHSEEWMNRMTSDTAVCANGMTDILPGFLGMLVRLTGALGMMFLLQRELAYILLPSGVVFVGITLILRKYLKSQHRKVQEKDGAVRVFLQEHISSMLILRTFGVEKEALQGANRKLQEHRNARMKKALVSNFCNTGFSLAMNGMYLLGLGYCGFGIVNGTITYGTLTAIQQLVGQLQVPLSGISGFIPRFYAAVASAERLMEIEEFKEAASENVRTAREAKSIYENRVQGILFDKVTFEYKKEKDNFLVLDEVSLRIQKGDYVAITGTSGCGKSTLLKLFMGIYAPKNGKIEVVLEDGSTMPVIDLKRLFAYVPQGNYLMSGTIKDIITFGKKEENKCITVEKALELACGEFVFELPEGIHTVLGEKGAGLSEGQMQRIAIARALYTEAPVLIMDEATSALDSATEIALLQNLKQLKDKTVFIVTHRPEALRICNREVEFTENGLLPAMCEPYK